MADKRKNDTTTHWKNNKMIHKLGIQTALYTNTYHIFQIVIYIYFFNHAWVKMVAIAYACTRTKALTNCIHNRIWRGRWHPFTNSPHKLLSCILSRSDFTHKMMTGGHWNVNRFGWVVRRSAATQRDPGLNLLLFPPLFKRLWKTDTV